MEGASRPASLAGVSAAIAELIAQLKSPGAMDLSQIGTDQEPVSTVNNSLSLGDVAMNDVELYESAQSPKDHGEEMLSDQGVGESASGRLAQLDLLSPTAVSADVGSVQASPQPAFLRRQGYRAPPIRVPLSQHTGHLLPQMDEGSETKDGGSVTENTCEDDEESQLGGAEETVAAPAPVPMPPPVASELPSPPRRFSPGGLSAAAAAAAARGSLPQPDAHASVSAPDVSTASVSTTGRLSGPALQAAWKARREAALAAIIGAEDLGSALRHPGDDANRQHGSAPFSAPAAAAEASADRYHESEAIADHTQRAAVSSPPQPLARRRPLGAGSPPRNPITQGAQALSPQPRLLRRASGTSALSHAGSPSFRRRSTASATSSPAPAQAVAAQAAPAPSAAPIPAPVAASAAGADSAASESGGLASLVASKVAALEAEMGRLRDRAGELDAREAQMEARRRALDSEAETVAGLRADTEAWCDAARAQARRALEGAAAEAERQKRVALRQAKAEASALSTSAPERSLRAEVDELRAALARARSEAAAADARYREAVDRHRAERDAIRARLAALEAQVAASAASGAGGGPSFDGPQHTPTIQHLSPQQQQQQQQSFLGSSPALSAPGQPRLRQPLRRGAAPAGAAAAPFATAQNTLAHGSSGPADGGALAYDPSRYMSASGSVPGDGGAYSAAAEEDGAPVEPTGHPAQQPSPALRHHILTSPRPSVLGHGVHEAIATGTRPDLVVTLERTVPVDASGSGGGKTERRFSDGSRVLLFRNGTEKEDRPDGTSIVRYNNGDVKRTLPSAALQLPPGGKVEAYYFGESGTLHTSYELAGGVRYDVFEFPSGQLELHRDVGPGAGAHASAVNAKQREVLYPDGTVKVMVG